FAGHCARHSHRPLLCLAALAHTRRAHRSCGGIGSSTDDRGLAVDGLTPKARSFAEHAEPAKSTRGIIPKKESRRGTETQRSEQGNLFASISFPSPACSDLARDLPDDVAARLLVRLQCEELPLLRFF